tara:strand:+ start:546 stop:1058 length:513 start_codon:yes stop_codon:yes gene_type:complete
MGYTPFKMKGFPQHSGTSSTKYETKAVSSKKLTEATKSNKSIKALSDTPKQVSKVGKETLKTTTKNIVSGGKQVSKAAKSSKVLNTLNKARKAIGLTPQGVVGMGLIEGGVKTAKWMGESFNKAENVNYNDPKYAKLAEHKYGTKGKSKNINKSKQLKSGDKIKAMGPQD